MSDKQYTEQDVRNIISMVCDQFNAGFAGRNEFIDLTIKAYAPAFHPSESAGVNEAYQEAYDIGYEKGKMEAGVKGADAEYELAFIPCAENDPRAIGGYTSYDGHSLCHVRELHIPVKRGSAVWVKVWLQFPSDDATRIWRWNHAGNDKWQRIDLYTTEGLRRWMEANQMTNDDIEHIQLCWLNESPTAAGDGKEDAIDPMQFRLWMKERGWTFHRDEKIWYRSDDPHQWPPQEVIDTTSELYTIFKNRNNTP